MLFPASRLNQPAPDATGGFSDPRMELPSDDEGKLILLSRTLSGLVDLIIVLLCSGVCIIAADFFSGIIALDTISYLIFSVLFLLIYFFYSLFFLAASNQTIGMMITDLRVVDADLRAAIHQPASAPGLRASGISAGTGARPPVESL